MDQSTMDPAQVQHFMTVFFPMIGLMVLFFMALYLIPLWQIVKKAGFHPALSLLVLVPVVNFIMLYVFAFSRWKVVPAPEYPAGYPPQFAPPAAYPPAYTGQPVAPAPTAYASPAAYNPAPPSYPPPQDPPR